MARRYRQYSENDIRKAVSENISWSQVLNFLNLSLAGGNYKNIQKKVKEMGLDTSHFKGRGWNLGGVASNSIPLQQCLIKGKKIRNDIIKNKLIKAGHLEEICEGCSIGTLWNGKPLTLELDHRDGDRTNNLRENLRLLCPNCHSQTPNFRGRKT